MRISAEHSDKAILVELGKRAAENRLAQNVSQRELAERAGVAISTVKRFEAGEGASLVSVVRMLRGSDAAENLDELITEPLPSPIDRLKAKGRQRQRASG